MNSIAKKAKDRDRTSLRLRAELIALIDQARGRRVGVISRNTWITEAIQEKLTRELSELASKEPEEERHANFL
jgi:hypothetical protein